MDLVHERGEVMERWENLLKRAGFSTRILPEHWDRFWPERRWYVVHGQDGIAIIEALRADEYLSIAKLPFLKKGRQQYEVCRFVSADYPRKPKTELYLGTGPPVRKIGRRTVVEILREFNKKDTEEIMVGTPDSDRESLAAFKTLRRSARGNVVPPQGNGNISRDQDRGDLLGGPDTSHLSDAKHAQQSPCPDDRRR